LKNPKILLHICCGVCGLETIKRLKPNFRKITLFFYNPNIHPTKEYQRRLDVVKKIAETEKLELIEGPYEVQEWFSAVRGLENEPEGSRRCEVCFKIRLEKSAETAKKSDCEILASTLTISPRKNAALINDIGRKAAGNLGIEFSAEDFKKKDGFKKTMEAAKKSGIYRQNYCGCVYSLKSGELAKLENSK